MGRKNKVILEKRLKKHARRLLGRVTPFEIWKRKTNPNKKEIEMYWRVVKEIKRTSIEGSISEIIVKGTNDRKKAHTQTD